MEPLQQFSGTRSERADKASVDASGLLLIPLWIIVVLGIILLLLFFLRKPRRPAEEETMGAEVEEPSKEPEEALEAKAPSTITDATVGKKQ